MKKFNYNSSLFSILLIFSLLLSLVSLFDQILKQTPLNYSFLFSTPFLLTIILLFTFSFHYFSSKVIKEELNSCIKQKSIFDSISDLSSIGIIFANYQGEILFANNGAKEILNISSSTNPNLFDYLPLRNEIENDKKFLETGETYFRTNELNAVEGTVEIFCKDATFLDEPGLLIFINKSTPKSRTEAMYQALLDVMDTAVVFVNKDGYIVSCNNAFLNFFDIDKKEILETTILEGFFKIPTVKRLPEERKNYLKNKIIEILTNGDISKFPKVFKGKFIKGNKTYHFIQRLFKIDLVDGDYLIAGLVTDITELQNLIDQLNELNLQLDNKVKEKTEELAKTIVDLQEANKKLAEEIEKRKVFEKELKKSEENYWNFIDNLPVGVYRTTLDGNFIIANRTLARILGCKDVEELKRVSAIEFYKTREKRNEVLQQHSQEKQNLVKVETELITKDGRRIFVNDYGRSLFNQETGEVLIDGIIVDVTDKYQIEKELEKNEKRFRELFENLNEILFQMTEEGEILLVSPSVEEVLGFKPEELKGENFSNLLEKPNWFERIKEILLEKKEARSVLISFKTSNNEIRFLKGDFFLFEPEPGIQYIQTLLRDVTDEIENQNFMSSIFTIFRTFNQERDLFEIADNIMKALEYLTNVRNFIFGVVDEEDNSLKIIKHIDRFGNRFFKLSLSDDSNPIIKCIHNQKISLYQDKDLDSFWFDKRYQPPSALVTIPLLSRSGVIGVMAIYSYSSEKLLPKAQTYYLNTLAEQISLGLERKLIADKLRVQLKLFEVLIESLPYPIYYRDLVNKKYRFCNSPFEVFAERPKAEIIGKTPDEIFDKEIAEFLYEKDDEVISKQSTQAYELIKSDSKGERKIYLSIRSPIIIEQLNEKAVVGILIDITERRQYEEELQKALEFNKSILDLVPVAIFTIDTDLNITSWNKFAEKITGYTFEEVVGNNCFFCDNINAFHRCEIIDRQYDSAQFEKVMKLKNKSGKELIISKKATQLRDRNGNLIGAIEVFEDITLKEEFQRRLSYLAETNSRLATISNLAINVEDKETLIDVLLPVVLQISNSKGVCFIEGNQIHENYTLTRLINYKFNEKQISSLFVPVEKFVNTYLGKVFLQRESLVIDSASEDRLIAELSFLNGERLVVVPLQSGEEVYGFLIVYGKEVEYSEEEISSIERFAMIFATNVDRIRYQSELQNLLIKQFQINELHSNFINLISHEYRTPLQAVILSAEILKKHFDKLTPEQKEKQFQRIEKAVKEMNNMLENVILYNKLSQPQERVNLELVDSKVFFESLLRDYILYYQDTAKINFKIHTKQKKVKVDYKLLQIIFGNIISNGVKYSQPNPEIDIDINILNDKIHLKFRDNGIGISKEEISYIFEPSYRGKNIKTISGTGLGLSIVKNAVDLLGGHINVESELGKGTTFEIELPLM
ncbi:MAG: PAS domain S-box protein [Bacteroidota bacterium]